MDGQWWSAVFQKTELEVENMTGSTFATKRMVCDDVHSVGGIDHVDVANKQLLLYCVNARYKYSAYLEGQKKDRLKVVAGEKRKSLSEEVSKLKVKRRALQTDAEALSVSADDFAYQAEKLQKLPLFAKGNVISGCATPGRARSNNLAGRSTALAPPCLLLCFASVVV